MLTHLIQSRLLDVLKNQRLCSLVDLTAVKRFWRKKYILISRSDVINRSLSLTMEMEARQIAKSRDLQYQNQRGEIQPGDWFTSVKISN